MLQSHGGTRRQSTEKQVSSKLLLQEEQTQFCFNTFFQFQNKAARLDRVEKQKKKNEKSLSAVRDVD